MIANARPMQGTDSMVGRYVRGTCALQHLADGGEDVLLYEAGDLLVCADHYRVWSKTQEQKQPCDTCGATGNVWRDPVSRKNVYLCINCHDPEHLFQNRWADWYVRESKPLGLRERVKCAVADNNCRGEVKWRSSANASLCNRHAGREGVGPNG